MRVVSTSGIVTTFAGKSHFEGDGGPATAALLHRPQSVVVATDGTIYFSDTSNHRVRKIAPDGKIVTVAGNGDPAFSGDGGSALSASLRYPSDIAIDAAGNLFVVDQYGFRVRKITPAGTISTVAGNGNWGDPAEGVAAVNSPFKSITGIAIDTSGNIYLSDGGNQRIRKVGPDGLVTTIAGKGTQGFSGDGGLATAAQFYYPDCLTVDKKGNLYVSDLYNYRVRMINASGVISTIAGSGQCCSMGEGGKATDAWVSASALAVDAESNLWIAQSGVRVIDASGVIRTLAGPSYGFDGDGTPAGPATKFRSPQGIALGLNGEIIVADTYNSRIRQLLPNLATRLDFVSGNSQTGTVGEPLPAALIVRLMGSAGGGINGVSVAFAVASGEAKLSATSTTTDASGQAGISVTPTKAGNLAIRASAFGFSASFNITVKEAGITPPPALTAPKVASRGIAQNGFSVPPVQDVSTGAITTIFGENFASPGSVTLADKVTTKLAGVCLTFGGSQAPIFAVAERQITVQVPQVAAGATVGIQVVRNCGEATEVKSNVETVTAKAATPELLYLRNNADGHNPVAAQSATYEWIGPSGAVPGVTVRPAAPNEILVLYGLGFGPTDPAFTVGEATPGIARAALPVNISIGGVELADTDILYIGLSPGFMGLYQINLRVPASLPAGDHAVIVRIGGQSSPSGGYLAVGQ